jgi:hypothetical protein
MLLLVHTAVCRMKLLGWLVQLRTAEEALQQLAGSEDET